MGRLQFSGSMWAQPVLHMEAELLKCCCLMYMLEAQGKTNECFSPDALSFGAEGHFLWVIWVRSICPPMFFLFNKCVLPFSRVSLAHFQFQFCPYPLFIDSVGFLISKFRLSINMSSNIPARGRWMLKIWSKCILNFYKGWFLSVSGVVEGVAQASNCDSVALLLDHPRLRAPPPCHLALPPCLRAPPPSWGPQPTCSTSKWDGEPVSPPKTATMVNFQSDVMSMVHFSTAIRYRLFLENFWKRLTSPLLWSFSLTIRNNYFSIILLILGSIILGSFRIWFQVYLRLISCLFMPYLELIRPF